VLATRKEAAEDRRGGGERADRVVDDLRDVLRDDFRAGVDPADVCGDWQSSLSVARQDHVKLKPERRS